MIAYILKFADQTNAFAVFGALGMTSMDGNGVSHYKPAFGCAIGEHKLITQKLVETFDPSFVRTVVEPEITLAGFWVSFICPERNAAIEALPYCLRGVDVDLAKVDHVVHEIYAVPELDMSGILLIDPLPMGLKTEYLLG